MQPGADPAATAHAVALAASAMFDAKVKDAYGGGKPNVWNEGADTALLLRGHPALAPARR